MLINRSDTCRSTLLPNGHAPRNMHRILLLFTSSPPPPLPCCTPAADYEHGTLHCLHVVFTHHLHKTSGNVFAISLESEKKEQVESAERMAETCPTKLLIILDWTTNLPPSNTLSPNALPSQALIIK